MAENTEVAVHSPANAGIVGSLTREGGTMYSSIKSDDFDTRRAVFTAVTSPEKVDEHLGKVIKLANIIVQEIEMEDEQTGKMDLVPRVILMDENNKAYVGMSTGLYRSVQNLIGILGEPSTWPAPVPIKVVQAKSSRNSMFKFFTVELA